MAQTDGLSRCNRRRFVSTARVAALPAEWARAALDDLPRDHDLGDAFKAWQVEHCVKQGRLHDGAQPARPGLAVDGLAGDGAEGFLRHGEINSLHLEQPLILLHQGVLWLGQDELERGLVEILKRRHDRKPADEFRDQAVLEQVLRLDVAEDLALLSILGRDDLGAEAIDPGRLRAEMIFSRPVKAPPDEQDVSGINLQKFLLRMLAAALRRYARDRALHDLEQCLLHALARYVAGDRGIVGFAGNLVDLVDIDDAALRALNVVIGRLQQLENDVLDVLADIAGFGQRRRIRDGKRNVETARQCLRQQCLAQPVGPINRIFDSLVRHLGGWPGVLAACNDCGRRPRAPSWHGSDR